LGLFFITHVDFVVTMVTIEITSFRDPYCLVISEL